jgi:hypothetical protein
MILDIADNPFYILGASLSDSREKIIELANEKYATCDVQIIDEAKDNLLDMNKRLYFEFHWFLESGSALEKILGYINKIRKNNTYFYYDVISDIRKEIRENMPNDMFISFYDSLLTFFNLDYYTFSFISNNDIELIAEKIFNLSWQQNFFNKDSNIINDINSCREIALFPEVDDKELIESSFKILTHDLKINIINKLKTLNDDDIYNIFNIIQIKCKNDRDYENMPIKKYLFSEYEKVIIIGKRNSIYKDFININSNPFLILEANITDNKQKIVSLCEEKMMLNDTSYINKAQEQLLNPQKRLEAEIRWFPKCSKEKINSIIEYLNKLPNIETFENINSSIIENLDNLEIFNIALYSFIYTLGSPRKWSENVIRKGSLNQDSLYYDINKEKLSIFIRQISELYESLDTLSIMDIINEKRKISKFPIITEIKDIENELTKLRENIKRVLSYIIANITLGNISDILIKIIEYYQNEKKPHGVVIDDFLSEYSLLSKELINNTKDNIISDLDDIFQNIYLTNIDTSVNSVLFRLKNWDNIVQPLQLEALIKGMNHSESIQMANKFRKLALYCNNELKRIDLALKIIRELKIIFAELHEFMQILNEDENTLNKIENEKIDYENRIKMLKEKRKKDEEKNIIIQLLLKFGWIAIFGIIWLFTQC